jgi:MFS family permease
MSTIGIGLIVIGLAPSLSVALAASLVIGTASGYNNILLITWLQSRVAPAMRGRIMSLMRFASVGLNPISTALAGVFIGVNATALLVCAGILMTAMTLAAAYSPTIRNLNYIRTTGVGKS